MNSAPDSASEPDPPRNTVDALRPQKAEGDLVTGCDAHRGGAANRTTRTAERDIQGIGGPHTGLGCLTGPRGRCTSALTPRKESSIPHYRKPEKHSNINYLSRGGGGGIRTHGTLASTTVFETVPFNHSGTPPLRDINRLPVKSPAKYCELPPNCHPIAVSCDLLAPSSWPCPPSRLPRAVGFR